MRYFYLVLLLSVSVMNFGCGGSSDKAAAGTPGDQKAIVAEPDCADCPNKEPATHAPIAEGAASGDIFQNLDYANWKQFKVGTIVRRKSVTTSVNGPQVVTSVNSFQLLNITDKLIEVSRQNTTDRGDGTPAKVNPGTTFRYPKQFAIPSGMSAEDFSKPALKAKKSGEEEVTVLGKKYKTVVYKWVDATEAGPMDVTAWLCEEIPGRIVKQMMKQPATNTTIEDVIEIVIK